MAAPLLVTPEAVVLDLTSAGIPTRLLARAIDVTLQLVMVVGVAIVLGLADSSGAPSTPLVIIFLFGVPLILLGYPALLETLWRGRTLGKAAMGLRVVTIEGAPTRFRHAIIRAGADIVDVWGLGILAVVPGIVGSVVIFTSRDSQRLGDMAAGTLVIRERSAARSPTAMTFTVAPGLESYADTVDVSSLTEADYQAARSFLLRAPDMAPGARAQVGASLAAMITARIHHQPTSWVGPEHLLAVVVARRQQLGALRAPADRAQAPSWSAAPPPVSSVWPARAADGGFEAPR